MILAHLLKWSDSAAPPPEPAGPSLAHWLHGRFAGFWTVWLVASLVGYTIYFGVGGFLHVSLSEGRPERESQQSISVVRNSPQMA